jgi:SpoU rRNA methylase family enzyme
LNGPFPALVLEKANASGNLGVRTVLTSLSATEFCMQLNEPVELGEELLVITQLSHAILLLRGEVTEVQKSNSGSNCVSLRITQHQIFSALAGDPQVERFNVKDSMLGDSHISELH